VSDTSVYIGFERVNRAILGSSRLSTPIEEKRRGLEVGLQGGTGLIRIQGGTRSCSEKDERKL